MKSLYQRYIVRGNLRQNNKTNHKFSVKQNNSAIKEVYTWSCDL